MKAKQHLFKLCLLTAGVLILATAASRAQTNTIFTFSSPPPPDGGTTSGDGTYQIGAQVWLVASNNSCWTFTNWVDNGGNTSYSNPYSITVTSGITNYTAIFVPTAAGVITALSSGGGTVSGGGSYLCGSNIVLTATPYPCWAFTNWSDGSTSNPYDVMASGDATYTANFVQQSYQINTTSSPAGVNNTTSGGGSYLCGSNAVLTATPDPCWAFANWSDGSTDNPHTVTASADATYTANFVQRQFTITTKVAPPGSGMTTGDTATAHCGDSETVTATPDAGYEFVNWTTNRLVYSRFTHSFQWVWGIVTNSPHYTFTVEGSRTLTANCLKTCQFSISPTTNHFPQLGGVGTVHVNTSSGCDWTYGKVYWPIRVLGVTTNSLLYAVDPLPTINVNTGSHQGQTIHTIHPSTFLVAGQTFTVLQDQVINIVSNPIPSEGLPGSPPFIPGSTNH